MPNSYGSNSGGHASGSPYSGGNKEYGAHGYTKESLSGGRDFMTPGKDPHQHWKEAWGGGKEAQNSSWWKEALMQWPIQMAEKQLQFVFASRADMIGEASALISDVDFRWLGIRNMRTIFISMLSLLLSIVVFAALVFSTNSLLIAYMAFFTILSHSLFPGYVTYRMYKFVIGDSKTKRYAKIIRTSWAVFEGLYLSFTITLYGLRYFIDWATLKAQLLVLISGNVSLKIVFYRFIEKLPIQNIGYVIEYVVNGLLVGFIFYVFSMMIIYKKATLQSKQLKDSIEKEHLRPAEIVKKKAREI